MGSFFDTILFQPIFNLLVLIYNFLPGSDFGLAIVILTILTRLLFSPLSLKTLRSQRALAQIQPKVKALQEKYKNDKPGLAQATMALYKEHKVNPFSGCLPILIQLPVLIALYRAFSLGLKPESLSALYSFVANPGVIKNVAFGFLDLAQKSPVLAVLAGGFQWAQSKLAAKSQTQAAGGKPDPTALMMNRQMLYFFPVMIIIIAWNLPTGLTLYWVVTTLFSIGEQWYLNRKYGQPSAPRSNSGSNPRLAEPSRF
ncbi:MAG: YidC/Oxa1 family membrane protein insertase [Patescibacteria group bacterium]